jgi:hypothetical protein
MEKSTQVLSSEEIAATTANPAPAPPGPRSLHGGNQGQQIGLKVNSSIVLIILFCLCKAGGMDGPYPFQAGNEVENESGISSDE